MSNQYRICAEKKLKIHDDHIKRLKNISTSDDHFKKLKAAFLSGFSWNNGDVITIGFIGDGNDIPRKTYSDLINSIDDYGNYLSVDPLQKDVDKLSVIEGIKKIVTERLQPIVNLKFVFLDDYTKAKVRISFVKDGELNGGAWSVIGTQCMSSDPEIDGKATMNLGWFDVSTTLHEFGHVLGMIHEHQNSNRNPIEWNKDAVYKWAAINQGWTKQETDTNILNTYSSDQINGSVFDPLSIMLYYYPAKLTLNNKGTNENVRLSGYDVDYLSKKYPGGSETPEEYYMRVYGESLKSNMDKSLLGLPTQTPISKYLKYLVIFLTILVIILFIFKFIFRF
jgi:hypothetical protein